RDRHSDRAGAGRLAAALPGARIRRRLLPLDARHRDLPAVPAAVRGRGPHQGLCGDLRGLARHRVQRRLWGHERAQDPALGAAAHPAAPEADAATVCAAHMPDLPELTAARDFAGNGGASLPRTLAELELLVRRDLDMTRYPAKSWVLPRLGPNGRRALDALIV